MGDIGGLHGELVDIFHVAVDLADHAGLFLGGGGDLDVHVADLGDVGGDLVEGGVGLIGLAHHLQTLVTPLCHGADRAGTLLLQAVDHPLDLGGRGGGAVGQIAHLICHHGETATLFTGASGLDGGVQCQQVGLLRDAADGFEDAADGVGLARQRLDNPCHLLNLAGEVDDAVARLRHHYRTRIGLIVGLSGDFGCQRSVTSDLAHRGPHFVDGGGHLHSTVTLGSTVVLGQLRLVGHLVGCGRELAGVLRHLLDGAVDLGDEVVEAGGDLTQFVTSFHLEALGEIPIAAAQLLEQASQLVERAADRACQQHPHQPHGQRNHQRDHQDLVAGLIQLGIDLGFWHLGHQIPVEQRDIAAGQYHGLAIYLGVDNGKGAFGQQAAGITAGNVAKCVTLDAISLGVQLHLAAAIDHKDDAALFQPEVGDHGHHGVEGFGKAGQPAPVELLEVDEQLHLAVALAEDAEGHLLLALGVVIEPGVLCGCQVAQKAILVVVGCTLAIGEGGGH